MKFIFVRHGESEANKANRIGQPNTKLTETGMEQAHQTGKKLTRSGIKIIVRSEAVRARQTAEIIAGELGIPLANIKAMPELNERRMGKLEGSIKDHEPIWYYTQDGPEFEPRVKLLERAHKALEKIAQLSKEGLVLVVGHAASGFYLLQAVKGVKEVQDIASAAKQIPNASYLEVEIHD